MKFSKRTKPRVLRDLSSLIDSDGVLDSFARVVRALQIRSQILGLKGLVSSGQLEVGIGTYGIPEILVSHPEDHVVIGRFCSIAPGAILIPGGIHPIDVISTFPFKMRWDLEDVDTAVQRRGPIEICDDVWLGSRVTVLSGVRIGVGSIVAAGSVVVRDVAPYTVVAGVPARLISERFDEPSRDLLISSEWWTLETEEIRPLIELLYGGDVDRFVTAVRRVRECQVPTGS